MTLWSSLRARPHRLVETQYRIWSSGGPISSRLFGVFARTYYRIWALAARARSVRAALSALAVSLTGSAVAQSQTWVTYDAALGTTPSEQCFELEQFGSPPAPSVVGGLLHVGPTGPEEWQYWTRNDFAINFNAGFSMEVGVQILTSECSQSGPSPWPRHGFDFSATDDAGRFVIVQLCNDQLQLANHPYTPVDGLNVKTKSFPVQGNA